MGDIKLDQNTRDLDLDKILHELGDLAELKDQMTPMLGVVIQTCQTLRTPQKKEEVKEEWEYVSIATIVSKV